MKPTQPKKDQFTSGDTSGDSTEPKKEKSEKDQKPEPANNQGAEGKNND